MTLIKSLLVILLLLPVPIWAESFGSTSAEATAHTILDNETWLGRFQMGASGGDTDSVRVRAAHSGETGDKLVVVIYEDDSDDPTTLLKAFTSDTITVVDAIATNYMVDVSGDAYTLIADNWYWIGVHGAVVETDVSVMKSSSQAPHRMNKSTGNANAPNPAGGTAYNLEGIDVQIFYTVDSGPSAGQVIIIGQIDQ